MKSYLDFPETEGKLVLESEKYTLSHYNSEIAWKCLITAENLKYLYDFVSRTAGDDIDDGKMFQHILIHQGSNALESIYWLVKHHQYNAARSRVRYLYETYAILRGLNRDQQHAAERWGEVREEAKQTILEGEIKPLERQPDILHKLRKDEKERLNKETAESNVHSDLYRMLSDRGSHPTSIRGTLIDRRRSSESENSLYKLGLVLAFGLVSQYVRTFAGTPTRWRLQQRADHVIVEVKTTLLPRGLPTLFREELYFWNPGLAKSPFLED